MHPRLISKTLDLAVEIQQIPAPTFAEQLRAKFIQSLFQEEGLAEVCQDEVGNVYGRLPGTGQDRPLVITAHLDTVFPANTDMRIDHKPGRIYGPGIGDNSLGVAGLFGLLWVLQQRASRLPGDVWLVANVGEEGLGDLRGMRAVVARFQDQPLAYIVLEGLALGQVYHRGLGVRRYQIEFSTAGGHSWVDYGQPSANHELAAFITRLTSLQLPQQPRTTLNVGVISGGFSVNTIAAKAHFELDLRSEGKDELSRLCAQVESMVEACCRPDVHIRAQVIGDRPAGELPANHPLISLVMNSLAMVGVAPALNIGSTDANIPLSLGLPAVCIGLTVGGGAHTLGEFISIEPVRLGLMQLVRLVEGVYHMTSPAPNQI
jgi:acetylornithine deacetylase/succinyl-diaminopimelate desuccinylase-like protein